MAEKILLQTIHAITGSNFICFLDKIALFVKPAFWIKRLTCSSMDFPYYHCLLLVWPIHMTFPHFLNENWLGIWVICIGTKRHMFPEREAWDLLYCKIMCVHTHNTHTIGMGVGVRILTYSKRGGGTCYIVKVQVDTTYPDNNNKCGGEGGGGIICYRHFIVRASGPHPQFH